MVLSAADVLIAFLATLLVDDAENHPRDHRQDDHDAGGEAPLAEALAAGHGFILQYRDELSSNQAASLSCRISVDARERSGCRALGFRNGCRNCPQKSSGKSASPLPKCSGSLLGGMWKVPNNKSRKGKVEAKFLSSPSSCVVWCQRWNTGLAKM